MPEKARNDTYKTAEKHKPATNNFTIIIGFRATTFALSQPNTQSKLLALTPLLQLLFAACCLAVCAASVQRAKRTPSFISRTHEAASQLQTTNHFRQPEALTRDKRDYDTVTLRSRTQPRSDNFGTGERRFDPSQGYSYDYTVRDVDSGVSFQQRESSDGESTRGSYSVALPDGRTQIVTYAVDAANGYRAEVTYEGEPRYPEDPPESRRYAVGRSDSPDAGAFADFTPSPVLSFPPAVPRPTSDLQSVREDVGLVDPQRYAADEQNYAADNTWQARNYARSAEKAGSSKKYPTVGKRKDVNSYQSDNAYSTGEDRVHSPAYTPIDEYRPLPAFTSDRRHTYPSDSYGFIPVLPPVLPVFN